MGLKVASIVCHAKMYVFVAAYDETVPIVGAHQSHLKSLSIGGKHFAEFMSVGEKHAAALVVSVQGGSSWHLCQWNERGELEGCGGEISGVS